MVKYLNEFGEVRHKKRSSPISEDVLRDLEALKLYADEPYDSVIKRLLQSMNPKEMTSTIETKLKKINAKMSPEQSSRIKEKYDQVHKKTISNEEWVQRIY